MRYEAEAQQYLDDLTQHRRTLHQMPELGNEEHETHAYLMRCLAECEPDELTPVIGTGIRCVFRGKGEKLRTIAFRADMDALPVLEPEGCPFASRNSGRMHACGHDGHMAILLTFAKVLAQNRDRLRDNVILIFQPAEETTGGARRMLEAGIFENPKVDEVYGLHMMPDVPIGKAACVSGPIMASTCEIDLIIRGRQSHGAAPHQGNDAILAAGYVITMLQSIVSRRIDPCVPAVVTIGKMTAGTQRNILAAEAKLEGIVRTYSNSVFDQIESLIQEVLRGAETAFGVSCELQKHVQYPCTENDPAAFLRVREVLDDRFIPAVPKMTAEDFSYYQLAAPGAFVFLGCMDDVHHSALHSPAFGFDEQALVYGLAMDMGLVFE